MGLTTLQQQQSLPTTSNNNNNINNNSEMTLNHSCASTVTMQQCDQTTTSMNPIKECAGCGKRIVERYLLKALDIFWHEDCLKCGCCDCRLGEVGSTLYIKANLILCKRDYLRLFGNTGACSACNKIIPAYEMVMRAKYNVYHLECFACFACQHRFCVGDKYYLCDNKILCPYDYEERLVFAGLADNPTNLAHMKRQLNNLQPVTESRNNSMSTSHAGLAGGNIASCGGGTTTTTTSTAALSSSSSSINDVSSMSYRIRPDRDDASSGYDSPDDSETATFEKPHQHIV